MQRLISADSLHPDFPSEQEFSIEIPGKCPNCGVAYGYNPFASYYIYATEHISVDDLGNLFSVYFCPHCEQCFFVHYSLYGDGHSSPQASILSQYPEPHNRSSFSDKISSLSPRFVEIFHQSEQAESSGLTEICGMGYRKALEFLVKDYAIRFHPDKSDSIRSTQLGPCINSFIDNSRIKTLAKASAWVGNDETHYVRLHEDYNLGHLKAFISAIVSYIDSELSFLEAESLLSNPKK